MDNERDRWRKREEGGDKDEDEDKITCKGSKSAAL